MSEVENNNVEVVVEPSESETAQSDSSQQKEPQKGSAEYNFREARKIMQEQNRRIQELEERARYQHQAPVAEPPDELEGLGQDEVLTRRQAEAIALRKTQEILAEREYATAEDRARLKFRDYDDVVTEENVKELIEDDPDVAEAIRNSPNPHVTAYKLIRKTNAGLEKVKKKSVEAEKVVKNAQKPVSSNAVQARPLANANSYAFSGEDERQAMYREMMDAARRR
jgi:hypothetical protein